ncbi:hypothetical protein Tsubulata_039223 [Turnera subulata]|uniref:Uncharacterized protein n=1 Tax=Turnera subulata TaxID=218843 RepID=A0A9Q0J0W1_9ROSI|nr:hypothetical protein Tsubulata_039223 [Turnera subulata]
MWSSIENLKQNLSKIALDVHDDEEELGIYGAGNGEDSSVSDRRNSHSFAHSKSVSISPLSNGTDGSPYNLEIEQYKAEIKKLQESEAEIKALSVNYAAILKEKEDQISRLNQENGSLKQNLDATRDALNSSRNESMRASTSNANVLKGSGDQSPKRLHRSTSQTKNRYSGNQMQNGSFSRQDGVSNGIVNAAQFDETKNLSSQRKEKELVDLLEEKNRSLAAMQATHESQLKKLQIELEKERNKVADVQLKIQEEHNSNEALRKELSKLKADMHSTSLEMSKLHGQLNDKTSEIRRLQTELSRQEDEDANESIKSLKRAIATLNQENTSLKIAKNELEAALEKMRSSLPEKSSSHGMADSSGNFAGKEELELSVQKLERDLNETRREKDKAVQELTRLKQHLLEKVAVVF